MSDSNFDFLAEHDAVFLQIAVSAERAFAYDPNTTLYKVRQLAEAFAQDVALRSNIAFDQQTSQADLLYQLNRKINLDQTVRDLFHVLRIEGNKAVHQFQTSHREALGGLKLARELAVWYHQSFGEKRDQFKAGKFIMPKDPSVELRTLHSEVEQLKASLLDANKQVEESQELIDLKASEAKEYEELAGQMEQEAKTFKELANEQESALVTAQKAFDKKLENTVAALVIAREKEAKAEDKSANDAAIKAENTQTSQVKAQTRKAASRITLSEELTRILIDTQLIDAGWETDTELLRYSKGARPDPRKNMAIAEWPTQSGPADYVLFVGLIPVAAVEAKRKNVNVASALTQAARYSKTFQKFEDLGLPWVQQGLLKPWPSVDDSGKASQHSDTGGYHLPFIYSCNGRPFIKQSPELSGTWFRDCRQPSNLARSLSSFHTPDGLFDLLKRDRDVAEQHLRQEGYAYLGLRDYQEKAIQRVESALEKNQRDCLLAMATGTGKTRTIIGLMYRFLKAERFKRILFLVDRTSLGDQAIDAFHDTRLEQNHTLSQIYDVKELGDMAAEAETRIQVATVQAMVKRIFQSDKAMPVDQFDCIIVDEAHRGYTLDQEMGEGELGIRDTSQYLSSYRRVLDYFDAVKIGLTATPAKHTSEIFGKPVYTYTYREAVADDWLIDHEPPIRYETLLSQKGIHFDKGETVLAVDTATGELDSSELEDELDFDVSQFNRRVINESFNKVICEQLVQELDPLSDEKTLIFCATNTHADMVKRLLDEAFKALYDDQYNPDATIKITGEVDKVKQQIKNYKNERYPNIAITVDLLTTGIDVPKICNLVFMRRVKSRILYEQMLGRATRRCDDIGKTVFRVYDPVDIYAALQKVSTMKPVVKNPNITLEQLVDEVCDPKTQEVPGSEENRSHADDALDALSQKVMRIMRKAQNKAERNPALQQRLDELEGQWGVAPAQLHQQLHKEGVSAAREFLQQHGNLIDQLHEVKALIGSERKPILSDHKDKIKERSQSYGDYKRPEDYLDSFNHFIKTQINESAALSAVVNKPRELTRAQLKEIRLLLDKNGYTEAKLKSAWRTTTNQEIAASIIGHIRQAAIGEALMPFDERVNKAMESIYAMHPWTKPQRNWLNRLANQLKLEVVIDNDFVNRAFEQDGGQKRLDKMLDGHLDDVMTTLAFQLWAANI
ncbi:MAG: type I restriction-modification system endonuclease [Pseudomonadales bacterium]|nr:type I restriction-modification system endonuclease [Pseudomonadales bacterium]